MTYAKGDRVVVSQFIRRGDDADVSELDGWVVHHGVVPHGEAFIVIANTPDWADLDPEDYFTATFALDDVIVSPWGMPVETG